MSQRLAFMTTVLGGALLAAGDARPVFAQWDPWLLGTRYQTSYYAPSFYGGYWTGYAPAPASNNCCYGPAPMSDCCCSSPCSSCSGGNCANGSCGLNAAPPGSPKPIPDTDNNRSNRETPVPGRNSPGGRSTWDPTDNRDFENPNRTGTGRDLDDAPPPKFRSGTGSGSGSGTGTNPADDGFRSRPGNTGTGTGRGTGTGTELEGNPDPFKANRPELNDPDLPAIPERAPAGPMDVKEESPLDADLGLELKVTSRPVLKRERQVLQSRFTTPSFVRTQARPRTQFTAPPQDARIARQ